MSFRSGKRDGRMNEEPYVYFIDNAAQQEVLDAEASVEAIEKGYYAWGEGRGALPRHR